MSHFSNFAVAGAGNIGKPIVEALLKLKGSVVTVLTRKADDRTDELKKLGAIIVEIDYDSTASLAGAVKNQDVVISTVGGAGLTSQIPLAEEAKKAGVKLFVPSEFGTESEALQKLPMGIAKAKVQKKLKELDLPYAIVQTGVFPDFAFATPFFGFDFAGGKINFGGSGETPLSWTSMTDAGRFLAHILATLPKDKLEWKSFYIEGDRQSFNAIISSFEKHTGKELTVTRRSQEDLEDAIKKNPNDIMSHFFLDWDKGGAIVAEPEKLSNSLWSEWNPNKALSYALKYSETQKK